VYNTKGSISHVSSDQQSARSSAACKKVAINNSFLDKHYLLLNELNTGFMQLLWWGGEGAGGPARPSCAEGSWFLYWA